MRLLTERPQVSISNGVEIPTSTGRRVVVDIIDTRLEAMVRDGLVPDDKQLQMSIHWNGWCGKIPGTNTYIWGPDGTVNNAPKEGAFVMPDGWLDYAYGTFDGINVKASDKDLRTDEQEKPQAVLDQENAKRPAESFDRRLHRVLCRPIQ